LAENIQNINLKLDQKIWVLYPEVILTAL